MGGRRRDSGGFFNNFIFFIGLMIAFELFWPIGIFMLLWKFGVIGRKKGGTASASASGPESKQSIRMEKYRIISQGRSAVTIDYLASAVGVSYDTALRDLQRMVAEGQFGPNAYINYVDRAVIITPASTACSPPRYEAPRNRPSGGAEGSNMISRDQSASGSRQSTRQTNQGASQGSAQGTSQSSSQSSSSGARSGAEGQSYDKLKKVLLIVGSILLILGSISTFGHLTELSYLEFRDVFFEGIPSLAMAGSGVGCLAYRFWLKRREHRFKLYAIAAEGRDFVSIADLASKAGISERKVKKDLEAMLERGLLPSTAYIDQGDGVLVLKPGANPSPEPVPVPTPEEDSEDRYKAILRQIRGLNDEIPDADVSRRIDEMEDLTGRIFRAVQEKPEKEPQIKSFMSYYLPTTLKLLRSYADFEKSGADGENIRSAKAEIESILDTLVDGFKKQLDKLYESDAIDIASDIDVLEAMMRRDGLTGDGSAFNVQQQGGK